MDAASCVFSTSLAATSAGAGAGAGDDLPYMLLHLVLVL